MWPDDDGPGDGLDGVRLGLALGGVFQSIKESAMNIAYNAGDALGITPAKAGMKWEATQVQNSDGTYSTVEQQVPRGTLLQDLAGHAMDGVNVAVGISSITKGTTATTFAKTEPEAATTTSATKVLKSAMTEPTLPPKTVVQQDGVKIEHYYKSGDHGPPHLHVKGGGGKTRIGQGGKPLKGDPALTSQQEDVVLQFKSEIRSAVNKIGKWFNYNRTE